MSAMLTVLYGKHAGHAIPLSPTARMVLGRADDCQVRLRTDLVSRHHCAIEFCEPDWFVRDLGSSNGTHVNGVRVLGPTTLSSGDRLKIGPLDFQFAAEARPAAPSEPDPASVFESSVANWLEEGASAAGDTVILSREETAPLKDLSGPRPQQTPPVAPPPSSRRAAMDALDSLRKLKREKRD